MPAAKKIADTIADAQGLAIPLMMSVVNIGEVWYSVARRQSKRDADQALRWIRDIGIVAINADMRFAQVAAEYKAGGGIAYADCFAAALVKTASGSDRGKAVLVTGDLEFKRLEKEISITWV